MAELPGLGEHCQVSACKQLDFLPFPCSNCHGIFCKTHSSRISHGCPESTIEKVNLSSTNEHHYYGCSYERCNNTELIAVICDYCKQNFCLGHRHQVDHECSSLPSVTVELTAEERVKAIIGRDMNKEKKGRTGVKNEERKLKVSLMKMKMNAVGDGAVPQAERLYFNVCLPTGHKPKHLYFSKQWTVGKMIDKASTVVGLNNQNNVASKKKLRLFHAETGRLLPLDQTLDQLLHSDNQDFMIVNGTDIILEYVHNDTCVLNNVNDYTTKT